jgi:F0F1-type ATP synthase membrane subunit b/b'
MNRTILTLVAIPLIAAATACDKSGADAQEAANKAQAQANTEITNAQVTADKKVADVRAEFAKTVEDYRHTTQANLDSIDKQLADIDAKAATATGAAAGDIKAKSTTLRAQRDAFASDFRSLGSVNATSWDATKARLDMEYSDLKNAVDKAK